MARLWRAFCADMRHEPGALVELPVEEARHLRRVLRLRAGDALAVFDGCGREWRATLVDGPAAAARARLEEELTSPVEAPLAVTLFQGSCRAERIEWVIQKATEIGVAAIAVLETARGAQAAPRARPERWRRVAIESSKQCGRRTVPAIELRDGLPQVGPATLALVLDPREGVPALGALLGGDAPARVWIACGGESGFAAEEVLSWQQRGWRAAGLGPRTLRTETAGVVAAAIVLHHFGDLGRA